MELGFLWVCVWIEGHTHRYGAHLINTPWRGIITYTTITMSRVIWYNLCRSVSHQISVCSNTSSQSERHDSLSTATQPAQHRTKLGVTSEKKSKQCSILIYCVLVFPMWRSQPITETAGWKIKLTELEIWVVLVSFALTWLERRSPWASDWVVLRTLDWWKLKI